MWEILLNLVKLCTIFLTLLSFCATADAAIAVKDDLGRDVSLKGPAVRIVSLYAGHTENLIAVGARRNLVAASVTDDKKIVGDLPRLPLKPGVEQILALKPDLVLARSMQANAQMPLFEQLKSLGVPVLVLDPPSWGAFVPYLDLLGRLSGHEDGAKSATARAKKLMAADGAKEKSVGVFLVVQGRTMSTCDPDSWAAHVVALAGGRNVAAGAKPTSPGSTIAPFGPERLLAVDDEIETIVLQQGAMNGTTAREFAADPRFAKMRAVRASRVYDVSEADISRPSLLRLEAGVKNLRKIFSK